MKEYIGSQEHWEDSVNADYDRRQEIGKQMEKDMRDEIEDSLKLEEMNKQPTNQPPEGMTPDNIEGHLNAFRDGYNAAMPPTVNPSGLQDWEGIAKTIMLSIDHYREAGRDDNFNVQSIADYLKRCFSPPSQPLGIEALAFGKYLAQNGWKPYSENAWENSDDDTASTEAIYSDFKDGYAASQSSTEEEKDLWGEAKEIFTKHYESYNYPSQAITELQSKFKISKR